MKKLNLIRLMFIFVLMLFYKKGNAQFLPGAVWAESGAGVTVSPYNTGNDILVSGQDTFRVSVYGDASILSPTPGLSWEVNANSNTFYSGSLTFAATSDITFADVCLVEGNGSVFAVVAWYYTGASSGNPTALYIEDYIWSNSGGWGFHYDNNNFWNVTVASSLNIDGDDDGDFVVVYDDGTPRIYAISGTMISGSLAFNNSGNTVTLPNGTYPDVSIYYDNSTTKLAHVAYIDASSGDLYVNDYNIYGASSLANPAPSVVNTFNVAAPNSYFFNPRIACPNSTNTSASNEWTVVVQEDDHMGTNYIEGYNNGVGTPIYYNTGVYVTNSVLTAMPNFYPVVAYDYNYSSDGIWVGWVIDNTAAVYTSMTFWTGINQALYPILLKCDKFAVPLSSVTDYWEVPNSISNGNSIDFLSMAARYGVDDLYLTYYNVGASKDIYTKTITGAAACTQLRTTGSVTTNTLISSENKLPDESAFLTMRIFDINGNLVFTANGTYFNIFDAFQKNIKNIPESIYFVQLLLDDGSLYYSKKVLIGK